MRHGRLPERDLWTTTGIWIVGAAAAAMSWTGWFLLAAMCGWPRPLAALLPLAVDVYVVTSARVWLRLPWVSDTTRKFAAFSTFFALGASIAANAAYHLMESFGWHRAPWGAVVAVSGLAPLMLALVAHLQARLNADRAAQLVLAEVPDAAMDVAPVVALEPVATATPDTTPVATAPATPSATEPTTPARQKTPAVSDKKRARAARLVADDPAIPTTVLARKCEVTPRTAQRWKKDLTRPHLVREEA